MIYTIQNKELKVTANTLGGELWTIHTSGTAGVDCLWEGKPEIWGRRAPVLFPWCSKIEGGWFEEKGQHYQAGGHGFIRDMEHTVVEAEKDRLHFCLNWNKDEIRWPWSFKFETIHTLEEHAVVTVCTAVNMDSRPMPVQLGFHPGLRCPFTPGKTLADYVIRFEQPELPGGTDIFTLTSGVFDRDSICFEHLKSKWIQIEEKETGHYLRVDTEGFSYVLLWSQHGIPGFVCIEPWTGYLGEGHDLSVRPGAVMLAPGESISRKQRISINV